MRNNVRNIFILLLPLSFLFTGCPDPIKPDGGSLAPGEMDVTASVEGNFFATDAVVDASGSAYLIKASVDHAFSGNANGHIVITLKVPKQTPPYTITVNSTPDALIEYCLEESPTVCTIFNAKQAIGSGTISITSVSPNIEGTFSGSLQQVGGSGTRSLSGGEFKTFSF